MLTEDEKRQLSEIESSLRETDPGFAERLAKGRNRQRGWRRVASQLGTIVALATAVLGMGLAHLDLAVPSLVAVAVALVALGFAVFSDR